MRRTASEVLRSLEMRVARLENRRAMYHPDDPRSQEMGGYRDLVGDEPAYKRMVKDAVDETLSELKSNGFDFKVQNNVLILKGVAKDFFGGSSTGITNEELRSTIWGLPLFLYLRAGHPKAKLYGLSGGQEGFVFGLPRNKEVEFKVIDGERCLLVPLDFDPTPLPPPSKPRNWL